MHHLDANIKVRLSFVPILYFLSLPQALFT